MHLSDFVYVRALSVLGCVVTHPGKKCNHELPSNLATTQEPPRNSVQEPGSNVQDVFLSLKCHVKLWNCDQNVLAGRGLG